MYKFGLKLWSTNNNYVPDAVRLFRERVYQYIELFIIPDSYSQWINIWQKLLNDEGIPFVIHAPHFRIGMNIAVRENIDNNMKMAKETLKYADGLKADTIIFHPGLQGQEEEIVYQLKQINDLRIAIENKPYRTVDGAAVCNGFSPEAIKFIMQNANVSFCLDVGHAFCSANSLKTDPFQYFLDFVKLKPKMFHLTDGDINSEKDEHRHIGSGNYDFNMLFKYLSDDIRITVETEKDYQDKLSDFLADINNLRAKELVEC